MNNGINVLSLFDGISCGMVALERAGIKVNKYFALEIDKYAIKISQKNYPDITHLGDVYNIDYSSLPKIDLVIGGSPCTYWSICKQNREITSEGKGFELFMQYVKAIKKTNPKYFLYENNNSIHKSIKQEISKQLCVQFYNINSELFSAQKRNRCYWTNIKISNITTINNIFLKDILENSVDSKYILTNKQVEYQTSTKNRNGYVRAEKFYPFYDLHKKAFCLTTKSGTRVTDNYIPINKNGVETFRKLTPIECERLQTLPENYTEGISDTQRFKCIGNGWTVDVIAHILSFMEIQI